MTQPRTSLIFDIRRHSTHDGPGIRTTVFFKGCPLKCTWCHNPEGIQRHQELLFRHSLCLDCHACTSSCPQGLDPRQQAHRQKGPDGGGIQIPEVFSMTCNSNLKISPAFEYGQCQTCPEFGICATNCPAEALRLVGKTYDEEEILRIITSDIPFYEGSGGGVTFSGGEPLASAPSLLRLLDACHALGISTAIETSAFAPREVFLNIARHADLLLLDLKGGNPERHIINTGVPLDPILANIRALAELRQNFQDFSSSFKDNAQHNISFGKDPCIDDSARQSEHSNPDLNIRNPARMIFRIPLIPGYNDSRSDVDSITDFLHSLPHPEHEKLEIHLLPYHDSAYGKYLARGENYPMEAPRKYSSDRTNEAPQEQESRITMKQLPAIARTRASALALHFFQQGFEVKIGG